MPTATSVLTAFTGIVAAISIAIYFFGIPPDLKRKMEKQALKTMGENKASYLVKDQISKMPASDQKDVKDFKKGLGRVGGGLNNPIGEKIGDLGDDLTKDFTGR